jgi:hypothetical protein
LDSSGQKYAAHQIPFAGLGREGGGKYDAAVTVQLYPIVTALSSFVGWGEIPT